AWLDQIDSGKVTFQLKASTSAGVTLSTGANDTLRFVASELAVLPTSELKSEVTSIPATLFKWSTEKSSGVTVGGRMFPHMRMSPLSVTGPSTMSAAGGTWAKRLVAASTCCIAAAPPAGSPPMAGGLATDTTVIAGFLLFGKGASGCSAKFTGRHGLRLTP